jgi:hypothetical protein
MSKRVRGQGAHGVFKGYAGLIKLAARGIERGQIIVRFG